MPIWRYQLPLPQPTNNHSRHFPQRNSSLAAMVLLQQVERYLQTAPTLYANSVARWKQSNGLPRSILPANLCQFKSQARRRRSNEETLREAAEKHKNSERNRRHRINNSYNRLRCVLPDLIKKDKASVLGETIKQIRELKCAVKDMGGSSQGCLLHMLRNGLDDRLKLEQSENERTFVKIMLRCDDRKELITELTEALRSVGARIMRAEMLMIGGRSKFVLEVKGTFDDEGMKMLRMTLNRVVDRVNENQKC